ncbi:DUF3768 domain-containing protein [uncultured Roseobacter sp.]|uniref:DUF3768 domain-containing protein n=1 Tax=uncultured Roseobacter sp. TaxID=114847 RepID=UPI0026314089|nr:DUF3768 domain-containing protein [uncultured Roseobacter sp.]
MAQSDFILTEEEQDAARIGQIAAQNDAFRTSGGQDRVVKGQLVMTRGVAALSPDVIGMLVQRLVTFDDFTEENDPYGDHCFGVIRFCEAGTEHRFFWKIDLFDVAYQFGSEDAANAEVTRRVLTLMLPEEY